jgi:hypothetical protein
MDPRNLLNISRARCPRCMAVDALDNQRLLEAGAVAVERRLSLALGALRSIATHARAFCVMCRVSP